MARSHDDPKRSVPVRLAVDLSAPDPAVLEEAARWARRGGVVIYPTDTLYGLGCRGPDRRAVQRVTALKGRAAEKVFPLLIAEESWLEDLVETVPETALRLQRAFWPGALTLVYRAAAAAPAHLVSPAGTIGLRISRSPVAQGLVRGLGAPLVATSANRAGEPVPADLAGILAMVGEGTDFCLDGGKLPASRGSTVVDVSVHIPRLLREGDLPWREVRELLGGVGD